MRDVCEPAAVSFSVPEQFGEILLKFAAKPLR